MEESSDKDDDWLGLDQDLSDDLCLDTDEDDVKKLSSSPVLSQRLRRLSHSLKDSQEPTSSSTSPLGKSVNTKKDNVYSPSEKVYNNRKVVAGVSSSSRKVQLQKKNNPASPVKRSAEPNGPTQWKKPAIERLDGKTASKWQSNKIVMPATNQSKADDSDAISIYANGDDFPPIYQSQKPLKQKKNAPYKVNRAKPSLARRGSGIQRPLFKQRPPDLRSHIRNQSPSSSAIADCNKMLDANTLNDTVKAACVFCKAYTDNVLRKGDHELGKLVRRLTGMLFRHKETKHMYRVVRFSITLSIELDDDVICGFVHHLCKSKEFGKVSIILSQIKDVSLEYEKRVGALVEKYMDRPVLMKSSSRADGRIGTARIVNQTDNEESHHLRGTGRSQLADEVSKTQRSGFFDSVCAGPSGINWKNSQLSIQIPNTNTVNQCRVALLRSETEPRIKLTDTPTPSTHNALALAKYERGSAIDHEKLGDCVARLFDVVGGIPVKASLFSGFADLIISTAGGDPLSEDFYEKLSLLDTFVCAAIDNSINKDRIKAYLSWICVEVGRQLHTKSAYEVSCFMKEVQLKLVPPVLSGSPSSYCKSARFGSADFSVNNCLEYNNLDLALLVVEQYFSEAETDFGPVLSPKILKMLFKVAEVAYANGRYFDAAKCCSRYPAGFGDGSEWQLMEDILNELLRRSEFKSHDEEEICGGLLEQMMSRGLVSQIRRLIVQAFSPSVFPVIKFLEGKGVYRKPQILECAHLIILPHVLCDEEMAMLIHRHLSELSKFLIETGKNIRVDVPFEIVLCRNSGCLQPLSSTKQPHHDYGKSVHRLIDTLEVLLHPGIKVHDRKLDELTKEHIINLDVKSVRLWMFENTGYHEEPMNMPGGI